MTLPATAPWLWPIRPSAGLRDLTWSLAGTADPWSRGLRGIAAASAAGAVPVLLSAGFGVPGHQVVSALLLALVCLACVRRDAAGRAVALALVAFAVHNAVVMILVSAAPDDLARILPGASDYWRKQEEWIRSGWDPEYEAGLWLPAHLGQLGGGIVYSYASLG